MIFFLSNLEECETNLICNSNKIAFIFNFINTGIFFIYRLVNRKNFLLKVLAVGELVTFLLEYLSGEVQADASLLVHEHLAGHCLTDEHVLVLSMPLDQAPNKEKISS